MTNKCKATMSIDRHGSRFWINSIGVYHRNNNLPAIEYNNGGKRYYRNGLLSRGDDLPAVEETYVKEWFINGIRHRDNDLPAVISEEATSWYKNGKLHRDNGLPAIEYTNGIKAYFVNGIRVAPKKVLNERA